ncbi:hypothetical protein SAMN05421757_11547 [Tropicimonas sediminicola]|uniref:Uncharacterized protein n=2 Tax=Tropicimonas sediminicola TaxID=1031541 RepID=A0A239MBI7_9RHOB|nr:hypothetical protein SAMN05421757_11547 [Tropicimonas sediminicola]
MHMSIFFQITATIFSVVVCSNGTLAADLPVVGPDTNGVIFTLGKEDNSRSGYRGTGWGEVDIHACSIGLDCHSKPFPSHLHAASGRGEWHDTAVEHAQISFSLGKAQDDVTLRLVRAGAETIAVQLDDGEVVLVTKSMMEPRTYEHSEFGAYDLKLGKLEAGQHVLDLSVSDDGEGNGRFGWDAIILRASQN